MTEIWMDVFGYEGHYKVSNLGKVQSLKRYVEKFDPRTDMQMSYLVKEHVLRLRIKGKGNYCYACLYKDKKRRDFLISRLVAKHFIPNPENKPEVNHIDGNKLNNSVDNLEWSTESENMQHAFLMGLNKGNKGVNCGAAKLTEEKVKEIILLLTEQQSQRGIAKLFEVSQGTVSQINREETWTHIDRTQLFSCVVCQE